MLASGSVRPANPVLLEVPVMEGFNAQSNQVWPEVSTFVKVSDQMSFISGDDRERESRVNGRGVRAEL
jgi:hypothetical protein